MANDSIKIINGETGEEIEREMSDEEQALRDAEVATYLVNEAAKELAKVETQENKTQLLEKLGITSDEAKLLIS